MRVDSGKEHSCLPLPAGVQHACAGMVWRPMLLRILTSNCCHLVLQPRVHGQVQGLQRGHKDM